MKNMQKLILPGLIVFILAILYFLYFAPSDDLGSFARMDTNSNASVPIVVKLVKEKGVQRTKEGTYIFYVVDIQNKEVLINGLEKLPPGISDSKSMVLTGHLSSETSFHAHGIELRN